FAYLGGISSVAGALVAGTLAPLGIGYVILDRLFDMGNSYGVFAGFTLVLTAILNQDGIVGAMRDTIGARRRRIPVPAAPDAAAPYGGNRHDSVSVPPPPTAARTA